MEDNERNDTPKPENNISKKSPRVAIITAGIVLFALFLGFLFRNNIFNSNKKVDNMVQEKIEEEKIQIVFAEDSQVVYPDYSILKEVLKRMNCEYSEIKSNFIEAVQKCSTENKNITICSIGASTNRQLPENLEYSHPVIENVSQSLLVLGKDAEQLSNLIRENKLLETIEENQIAIQQETTIDDFLKENKKEFYGKIQKYEDIDLMIHKLKKGQIKGIIVEDDCAILINQRHFDESLEMLELPEITESKKYPKYNISFILNKKNQEFNRRFNEELKKYIEELLDASEN